MVHLRINGRESNPNKHVNFISALPAPGTPDPYSEEDARQLLRALAAQVRPIMKSHGFAVNSLEEYEYNRVFAGRNWNNGETIELVLRRPDGNFTSIPWLLGTLCHELAHIKHMNHGRDFQKLWTQLRMEVQALQQRGYFGDGYWSSGARVSDSARVGGQGVEDYDLPEYICGGAQTRSRPKSLGRRRRVQRRVAGPSRHTGAQVEKRRKPGTRVKAKGAFTGEGQALNSDITDEENKARGTGFRKQAGSKRAREERALAAEKRLKSIKEGVTMNTDEQISPRDTDSLTESESESEDPPETDEGRRRTMQNAMKDDELTPSQQFMKDFFSEAKQPKEKKMEIDDPRFKSIFDAISLMDDDDGCCDIPSTSNPVVPQPSKTSDTNEARPAKRSRNLSASPQKTAGPSTSSKGLGNSVGYGRIVQEEMTARKRQSLGMTGGRKLGSSSRTAPAASQTKREAEIKAEAYFEGTNADGSGWSCLICTLDNLPNHLACSACGTPRGESNLYSQ